MRLQIALLACLGLVGLTTELSAAPVSDALREELRLLSEDIAGIVRKAGGGAVAIGEFGGSVEVVGHAGPRIQLVLSEELRTAGVSIDNGNHRFEISGRYQPFHDTAGNREKAGGNASAATNLHAIKLVAFLIDRDTGEPLVERPTGRLIFGSETVPSMLGTSTSNKPLRDPRDLSNSFNEARRKPQVEVTGKQLRGRTGHYAVEVLVKRGGKYVSQTIELRQLSEGSADLGPFTELKAADIYAVRLINNSPHEAAVDLRIDGVNCFTFSDSKSQYWIVPPNSHLDVLGWHRNDETTTEFKVVANFPDTAAAKLQLKPSTTIGLITASFSASWAQDEERPDDEPEVQGRGTGFGDDIRVNTGSVSRTIGQVRDHLSVRYEK
ncbi:MAG: hypothetical protein KDA69_11725 [Planctomycetaceae bacterium]|nr:hypothetical protein [Planctomycetaceae bacterium]MCA9044984.1 hypothetical protein [Planctomycetaceae bacterium]